MPNTYLIIPGYGNSNEGHWQSYFLKHLPNSIKIEQESWEEPLCEDWISTIQEEVLKHRADELIFVCHSLGCIALFYWFEKYKISVKGAMLVAPPDIENPYMDLPLSSFLPIPSFKLPFKTVVVASTNDHWASVVRTKDFAENWESELIFIGDAGHINTSSGYGEWESGLQILKESFI